MKKFDSSSSYSTDKSFLSDVGALVEFIDNGEILTLCMTGQTHLFTSRWRDFSKEAEQNMIYFFLCRQCVQDISTPYLYFQYSQYISIFDNRTSSVFVSVEFWCIMRKNKLISHYLIFCPLFKRNPTTIQYLVLLSLNSNLVFLANCS